LLVQPHDCLQFRALLLKVVYITNSSRHKVLLMLMTANQMMALTLVLEMLVLVLVLVPQRLRQQRVGSGSTNLQQHLMKLGSSNRGKV